ncbi:MAG: elongation factor G, partial [Acidimicrobiia bacterium]|nr:elongation factor G [Acidimicrobiia bacterium]
MKAFAPSQIRNVVLVGHGGSGKTSLAEAMLFQAGVINRLGRVEDGNTAMDHDPAEREKHVSMNLALAQFAWRDHKINLIDTPGFPDFVGEVSAAMRVADLALFVVNAIDPIEVQTEIFWRMARDLGLPRMVFVNKMDRERADFDGALAQLNERFGGVAPLQLPIGAEADFKGIASLLLDAAYVYTDGKPSETEMPADLAEREHQAREVLVENIVASDDDMLERYLEGEVPESSELAHALGAGVAAASVFPVMCGSATNQIGIDRLLDQICDVGPSPLDRGDIDLIAGGEALSVTPDPTGETLAFVFKSVADRHLGQLSLIKILSGTLKPDDHLVDSRSGNDVRLHSLLSQVGAEQTPAEQAVTGDIVAVAKLNDVQTNDTLAPRGKPVQVPPIAMPRPTLPMAIHARTQSDEDKMSNALHRLLDEDPSLKLERNEETRQTILWGQGETHLRTAFERMERKFGVGVDTEDIKIAYRETIQGSAEAEGRHKKQSGGRGQFGVAFVRVNARDRGDGFEFVDAIVGGAVPRQFIPAVEKGVLETMDEGGALGFPVVDVSVTLYDGKFHAVDSDEMSFKIAGRLGFREACAKASPILLEPISRVEVSVPGEVQGDVMGDLNSRRGRVLGTEAG